MSHNWEMDLDRTRMDIGVLVWKCRCCGCLQVKNGGLEARSRYRPNDPGWSPFRSLDQEPPCRDHELRVAPRLTG